VACRRTERRKIAGEKITSAAEADKSARLDRRHKCLLHPLFSNASITISLRYFMLRSFEKKETFMRAVQCKEWGGPEKLVVENVPSPAIKDGAVRIAIHAVGINFADLLLISGQYQEKPSRPAWNVPAPSLKSAQASLACALATG
jgi:hypothetical protein